jgi:hypothetical protein
MNVAQALVYVATSLTTALGLTLSAAAARPSCAIVGDSIAVGAGLVMPECLTDAKGGIPSAEVISRVKPADVLFISAGSNDPSNPQLENNLEAIRAKASAAVVWIEPVSSRAAAAVRRVAAARHDSIVQFEPSSDGVHPKSYRDLAISLRKYLK